MILANLDKVLEDAGYKLVFPSLASINNISRPPEDRAPRSTRPQEHRRSFFVPHISTTRCLECSTPVQSDDVNGLCADCSRRDF